MEQKTQKESEPLCKQPDGAQLAPQEAKAAPTKGKQFLQFLVFTAFSISAGVIQFVTTGALSTWTGLIPYWIGYLIGLVLSVVWNFTFNRKFTFRSASNVPLAMLLVFLYYCAFTPLSTFGADAIVDAWKSAAGSGWSDNYELVITASMMIVNFITEFLWDKFVVFNDKVMAKIERALRIKNKSTEKAEPSPSQSDETNGSCEKEREGETDENDSAPE